nr:MAG TPA: hypothetical protein [Caudoviricetes sp.]
MRSKHAGLSWVLFLRPNTSMALNCCMASDTDDNG